MQDIWKFTKFFWLHFLSRICLLISIHLHACFNSRLGCRVHFQILNKNECPDVLALSFQFLLTDFFPY